MRGQVDPQGQMFSYFSPESRVPADHPLRSIKAHTDQVVQELSGELDALYAETGFWRPRAHGEPQRAGVDFRVSSAVETETAAAAELLTRQGRKRLKPISFGADNGYSKAFVEFLRRRGIRPHIAQNERRDTSGLNARTTRHESYWISQRKRKRVEEIFGCLRSWGGLRRTRFRGIARVQLHAHFVGAAYTPAAAESFATASRISVSGVWR